MVYAVPDDGVLDRAIRSLVREFRRVYANKRHNLTELAM
jgi:hypothetical protein